MSEKNVGKEKVRRIIRKEIENVLSEDQLNEGHLYENQLDQLDEAIIRLQDVLDRMESEAQNINMFYGDGGPHSKWLNGFIDDLVFGSNDYYDQLKEFKKRLKDEYPDYDWSFRMY